MTKSVLFLIVHPSTERCLTFIYGVVEHPIRISINGHPSYYIVDEDLHSSKKCCVIQNWGDIESGCARSTKALP